MEHNPVYKLRDFSKGIVSNEANPLAYPIDALLDGSNVIIQNRAIKTRPGYTKMKDAVVASGVVRSLTQVRFPTNEVSYLLAQVGNKIYVSTTNLPSTSTTWTEIYDLGTGSGVISVATLNDRAVLTEGITTSPLVFLGCQETNGSDWAIPLHVLLSFDGTNHHNVNEEVLDKDSSTYADLTAFPANDLSPDNDKAIYMNCDVPSISGIYAEIAGDGNAVTSTATVQYWSGSAWVSVSSQTDNTASAGATFAQSGTITFTEATTTHRLVGEVPGYWFRIVFSAALSASPTTVWNPRILFKADCQLLQNIGDGQLDTPMAVLFHVNAAGSDITGQIIDFTARLNDYTKPTFHYLDDGDVQTPYTMTTGDYLYFGFPRQFTGVLLEPEPTHPNTATAKFSTPQVWTGTTWANVSNFADGTIDTATSTISLNQKGTLSWSIPSVWKRTRPFQNANYPNAYWCRVSVDAALSARTGISEARIYPIQTPLSKQKLVSRKVNRIVFGNTPAAPDQVLISRRLAEYGFCGPDAYGERIGGQDALTAMVEIYNQIFMFKLQEGYMLNGTTPSTYSFERAELSGQVPLHQRVCVVAPIAEADAKNKMGFYYLNSSGIYHFTGLQLYRISDNVGWFSSDSSTRIEKDYLQDACGVYFPERNWVIFAVPLITTDTPSPTTNTHLIVFDLTLKAWLPPFRITESHGGITSLCVGYEYNASGIGKLGRQGLYAGTSTGYVLELFNPTATTDAGTAITSFIMTGWLDIEAPELVKNIKRLALYGTTDGDSITVAVYADGEATVRTGWSTSITDLSSLGANVTFKRGPFGRKLSANFYKLLVTMSDETVIYGIDVEVVDRRF